MEKHEFFKDNKRIMLYKLSDKKVPLIYTTMYEEAGNTVILACKKAGCKEFNLVSISNLNWDDELSPWESAPVVSNDDHFTGSANDYLRFIENEIIPIAEKEFDISKKIICGYSMAGLFALYSAYFSNKFDGIISVSGSLWYPKFYDFAKSHEFKKIPEFIYLSLGDRESKTNNSYLNTTQGITEKLAEYYQDKGINSIFELNHGNHYSNVDTRLAKAIKWSLEQI